MQRRNFLQLLAAVPFVGKVFSETKAKPLSTPESPLRQTGRTQRMLEEVIACVGRQEKSVLVFGHNLSGCEILSDRLAKMLTEKGYWVFRTGGGLTLHCNNTCVTFQSPDILQWSRGQRRIEFWDHAARGEL